MSETINLIGEELRAIREDINYIKKHMIDSDTILTCEENARLNQSLKEYNSGKATFLEDFQKKSKR